MFEDLEEENPDVTPDSPDRAIAWAIHSRGETGLTPEECWAILHERYPDEPRFLLLHTYAELTEARKAEARKEGEGVWTPSYLLKKLQRILAGASADELHPHIRDLVVYGGNVLATAKDEDAKLFAELRPKIRAELDSAEPKRDDRDRAGLKLRRYEREVVKELHDRTQDNKPLGTPRTTAPQSSPRDDWATSTADKSKPRRKYAADSRFERGELIEHPKFGVGVVTALEPGKVHILFESGSRKLIAAS